MKKLLATSPRNLALFTLGINTALRASDLLAISYGDVKNLKAGEFFHIREKKTGKKGPSLSIRRVLGRFQGTSPLEKKRRMMPLFFYRAREKTGRSAPSVFMGLLKAGAARYASAATTAAIPLKTFGYHQRTTYGIGIEILMEAFNHSSPKQTKDYLGIGNSEVFEVFMNEI